MRDLLTCQPLLVPGACSAPAKRIHAQAYRSPYRSAPPQPHPDPRRRDGHHDPELQALGGGLSRRALCRLPARHQGEQRPAGADPAGDHPRDPRGLSRGRCRHHRDQHLQLERRLHGGLPHGASGARAQPCGGEARARGGRSLGGEEPGQAALRRGCAGSDHAHRIALARCKRPRLPQRHLRQPRCCLRRSGARPRRRRSRSAARRDHLRHAERQGRALCHRQVFRRARRASAGDDLRHHHRRERPHIVGTDGRGILELGRPRAAAVGGPELRARRQADAAPHRGALTHRERRDLGLSQRRAAESARRDRLRRNAGADCCVPRGIRSKRLRQHRRRLLRHDARSHPRHRGSGGEDCAAKDSRDREEAAAVGPRAAQHRR